MKETKKRWLLACNRMLAGGLTLLGFAQCTSNGDEPVEYGQPNCTFELKGKVKDQQEQVVDQARIILRRGNGSDEDGNQQYSYQYGDTLDVQEDGTYLFRDDYAFPGSRYRVVCYDPTGVYKADSTEIKVTPTGGDGHWNYGSDSKEVNFTLQKNTDE
ncbi:MAG: radical SAM-associated putative lipoprotein [Prevotellaceae bacterium]|jgi:putative lipoprotein (rSAM/lipoprotein system)|nr:radical SAM-associated putative lipoprotein [Prevotellaceae bacterium]